ncbi:RHS repeat domain-containing protein [Roseateles sp. MS654]|uniref:RHS repeat domain-containing protein n=1 Tax=Roseateles sp. MS654 TaxID=3412685 RepID=UPI003C30E93B
MQGHQNPPRRPRKGPTVIEALKTQRAFKARPLHKAASARPWRARDIGLRRPARIKGSGEYGGDHELESLAGQSSVNYSWTYDQSGGDFGYGIGRLTAATGTAGNTKYGYDARGLVITVIQTVGTVVQTTRYGYNDAGRLNRITYPSGRVVTIQYANGLPTSMSVAKDASSTAQPLITDIQWEPFGGVRSWQIQTAAGPQPVERISDLYGRLVRYSLGSVVRDITYDAADRIVSYTHLDATTGQATAAASALNQSFGYDEVSRLTSIVTPSASWTIGYDANGNRTGVTLNGTARSYTTEATSNRLSSISNPTRSFSYDAAGNTLTDTGLGYTTTYRLDNRINSLTKAGVNWYYSYDAGGQRIRKMTGSTTTHFVYDQSGQLLGQYAGTAPSQEFVWLGDIPVAVLNGAAAEPEVFYVYSDHLNAPCVVVDKNSATRWRWISEPFGTTAPEEAPAGLTPVTLNLRFPGQYFDKESGLSYNYFRDYDGTSGRYVQSDPIGLDGGINTYAYVGGNPLLSIDPYGLVASLDPWFGHGHDQGFKDWWHKEKNNGVWFCETDEGYNKNKPKDIPNKQAADILKQEYERQKAEKAENANARKSNGPRPQRQRGNPGAQGAAASDNRKTD